MKFTTSIIPLLALAGVQALPDSGLEARQAGQVTIAWNSDAGCNGNIIRLDVLPQLPAGTCTALAEPLNAKGFRVIAKTTNAPARIYDVPACNETSHHVDIPGVGDCSAFQNATSLKWLP
ncbi:hypothetical protein G7054_g13165 [Neopestalotiopsis clavispora]|nr:hypothetical protein G7054_g13165 [Neopestalotiopsis clavispora]